MKYEVPADVHFIESDVDGFAHIANAVPYGEKPKAACGKKSFPWDWHRPVKRTKPICRGCLGRVRGSVRRR